MSIKMSDFCRCLQAGFKISAAKFLSNKEEGWQPVVRAKELEQFLALHNCEPVGDTAEKFVNDLYNISGAVLPAVLILRLHLLCTKK